MFGCVLSWKSPSFAASRCVCGGVKSSLLLSFFHMPLHVANTWSVYILFCFNTDLLLCGWRLGKETFAILTKPLVHMLPTEGNISMKSNCWLPLKSQTFSAEYGRGRGFRTISLNLGIELFKMHFLKLLSRGGVGVGGWSDSFCCI